MAKKLNPKELVFFEELLINNSMEYEALAQLLVEKGILTFGEFFNKLTEVKKNHKTPL